MDTQQLQEYLHTHIPLSAAMGVEVCSASDAEVVLGAPLGPNINHRETVFGGSVSALAILAAWSLLHVRLSDAGLSCRIVIQRNSVDYDAPLPSAFFAKTLPVSDEAWQRFGDTLAKRGRARITITCVVEAEGQPAARFEGAFVAINTVGDVGLRS